MEWKSGLDDLGDYYQFRNSMRTDELVRNRATEEMLFKQYAHFSGSYPMVTLCWQKNGLHTVEPGLPTGFSASRIGPNMGPLWHSKRIEICLLLQMCTLFCRWGWQAQGNSMSDRYDDNS